MIKRQKVLAAAHKLQTFTVESLAESAGVKSNTVSKVLAGNKAYFDDIETKRGKRGRPVIQYRVKPSEVEELSQDVSRFQDSLNEIHGISSVPSDEDVTADLLAAESYVLDQFPAAETEQEKTDILRSALQHLNNDRQLAPTSAASPRRKVTNALTKLSFDELSSQRMPNYGLLRCAEPIAPYQHWKVNHILRDIVPEIQNLTAEYQSAVTSRLEKSPLVSSALSGNQLVPMQSPMEAVIGDRISIGAPDFGRIEFLTTNRSDAAVTDIANALASAILPSGLKLDVQDFDASEIETSERPLMMIVGCNSGNPSTLPTDFLTADPVRYAGGIMCFVDVGFHEDFRDGVFRRGHQYVPNVRSMDSEVLLNAMQPLAEVINDYQMIRQVMPDRFSG